RCDLELTRSGELELPPLSRANLGISPFQSHGPIVLTNHGEVTATLLVTTPQSGTPMFFNVPAGGQVVIPAHSGPQSTWNYSIENPSQTATAIFGVTESYGWSLQNIPVSQTPFLTVLLHHDDELLEQSFRIQVRGTDPTPGRMVHVSVHDPGMVADAPELDDEWMSHEGGQLLPALPNPFRSSTTIAYELAQPGDVRLEVFDAGGRQVRTFDHPQAQSGRGLFEWDGTSDAGNPVPPGV